jgi:hypothetical protein
MRYIFPFRFWDECGESEPVEEQCTRINRNLFVLRLDNEGIVSVELDFHRTFIIASLMSSSTSFR